jgi:membrane protein insertase Oxa1/YidC/SpoIIIJ
VLVYWCTNNIITLIQSNIVRHDAVSKFLNIPKPPPTPPGDDTSKISILEQMKKVCAKFEHISICLLCRITICAATLIETKL